MRPNFSEVQRIFQTIDTDRSGFVDTVQEFQELMKHAGVDPSKGQSFLQACDFDGDGKISVQDYLRYIYLKINHPTTPEFVMFLAADSDCSGSIDPKELYSMLIKLDAMYQKYTEPQLQQMIHQITGGKGDLNLQQFTQLLKVIGVPTK
uniref:EF-hand domain pair-containing protein n=1 Tax=Trepomonas sp. PC1 TaxID=1076344 RepID=A0A146K809_9EUKA|eukprot:JAP92943.1 EF-hand domain pair-containing protein [Trepomonas sp. PC1]